MVLRQSQIRTVLARVRTRVHDYLTRVEQELSVDAAVSSTFETVRDNVDTRLRQVAPEAFAQFASAQQRRSESNAEARAQALTSCRRALKTVADAVYPARDEPVVGADGKSHAVTENRYVSRLLQYVFETRRGRTSAKLLEAQIAHLGARLEALNDLDSKGVHDNVSAEEVDQTILETYMVIGEVLRLGETGSLPPQSVEAL